MLDFYTRYQVKLRPNVHANVTNNNNNLSLQNTIVSVIHPTFIYFLKSQTLRDKIGSYFYPHFTEIQSKL